MGRNQKAIVDYFPHDVSASEGRTLTIMQSKFGNDGYACFFKLLELLGRTDGHAFDFSNYHDWLFLLTKMGLTDAEEANNILLELAKLGAIDEDLYVNEKIIWCQKFVDNLSTVYKRRNGPPPKKPSKIIVNRNSENVDSKIFNDDRNTINVDSKIFNDDRNTINVDRNTINVDRNTQSKVKEKKVETPPPPTVGGGDGISDDLKDIFEFYETNVEPLKPIIRQSIIEYHKLLAGVCDNPKYWLVKAIKIAASNGHYKWSYIRGILDNSIKKGDVADSKTANKGDQNAKSIQRYQKPDCAIRTRKYTQPD